MIDVTAIRARAFHVALDCVRGAGASAISAVARAARLPGERINLEPDGRFPQAARTGARKPRGGFSALVRRTGADIGLAVDPDVDRLALVDEHGQAIGEDYPRVRGAGSVGSTHQ